MMKDKPDLKRRLLLIARYLLLCAMLLAGGYLRFTNLDWDEGLWIHPDESHMQTTLSHIHLPDDPFLYFDTHRSPLNVRNDEHRRYSYGTLPLFLARSAAEWLDRACLEPRSELSFALASLLMGDSDLECRAGTFTGYRSKVVGRALSALADLGTMLLVYLIGRRLYGQAVGLLAMGLGLLTAFCIQQAHFFTVDSTACFFTILSAYFAVRAARSGGWTDFGLAGLAVGAATACKVSAALAALLVALAAATRLWSPLPARRKELLWRALGRLLLAGVLALVAFRVFQPYAFEGPGFFGVRLSEQWVSRLSQIQAEQSGDVDYPSGRQWTNRAPILFALKDMLFWGMGLPLGLAAWAAWAFVGYELWRGKRAHLVLWGWSTLLFLYHSTRWVKTMRTFLPLYPLFAIFAAYLLVRLCRARPRLLRRLGYGLAVLVVAGAAFWALAVFSIYLRPHTRLAASRWIYSQDGIPPGSTIAGEHWDWGPPLPLDGFNPGTMYEGVEMRHYDDDTQDKRVQLFGWLDRADYVIIGSNRLYASISRLPARYPLTIEYYRALFAGELGFELAADFTSYPALGPFQFPDQEQPFPLMEARDYVYQAEPIEVSLPPADEAFSVYDHPRVLIFRKTEAYSRQLVESRLGWIDVGKALHGLTPAQATGAPDDLAERVQDLRSALGAVELERALEIIEAAPDLLEFDAETWADQQAGGTWAEMFDRESLLNRYPGLAAIAWWLVVTLLGWAAFPLAFVALSSGTDDPRLRDGGYGLARVLGLLLMAYLTWLAASLRVLPNTRGTIVRMLFLLALVGGGVGWFQRKKLRRFVRRRWRLLLLTEGLFALLYLFWVGVRLLHPDLWHQYVGGEKPMDFAYLNAVMKSTWFPPYNPWLSGSRINYYYFGFVIVGALIKLMGTVPALAYNLATPLLFALTGVGAFSVAYNLFEPPSSEGGHRRGALWAGVAALVFTVLLGNLGVVHLILQRLVSLGGELFPSTVPGFPETVAALRGLIEVVLTDATFPVGPGASAWYWHPTRIIPAETGNPIAEFPAFTFLYGDLHAHMIAFPLTLLALTLMVHWVRSPRPGWFTLLVGGLVIGALRPTNTWDYYGYLPLGLAALVVGACAGRSRRLRMRQLGSLLYRLALLVVLTALLYLPYIDNYVDAYGSVELWQGPRTPAVTYLWIHAIMLWPVLTFVLIEVNRVLRRRRRVAGREDAAKRPHSTLLWWLVLLGCALGLILAVNLLFDPVPVGFVALPVMLLAALLLLAPGMSASRRLLWLMVGLAMSIAVGVEIVVVEGDIGRQNTVFKFYLQAWMLLSIVAAIALAWVRGRSVGARARRWPPEVRYPWWVAMALLVAGGALFLPFGIRSRALDRMSPQVGLSLDGMAFMKYGSVADGPTQETLREISLSGDYAAIRWMQDNVEGSPVVLEAVGRQEYLWSGRVSIYTGLPTVVGWRWHQVQQRAMLPETLVSQRMSDVRECYDTTDVSRAREILARYGVRYIYVGEYERAYYDPAGLAKFDAMAAEGLLRLRYDVRGVKIYETISDWDNF